MSHVYSRGMSEIRANLTPMIDVTFLLIVFFVLVSQIVDVEHVEMNLPKPNDPASEKPSEDQRVVINVMPGPLGEVNGYKLGTRVYSADEAGMAGLTARLAQLYEANPTLDVNLRADRATHYKWVQAAIQAVGEAAGRVTAHDVQPRVNLAVERQQ